MAAVSARSGSSCRAEHRSSTPRRRRRSNARTSTIKQIAGCMVGALAPVLPGKVPAASAGELHVLAFGGKSARRRKLCRRRADRRRQRRRTRRGRGRCHRDRRHQLHEPAGRGARDGSADPPPSGRAARRFRRLRRMAAAGGLQDVVRAEYEVLEGQGAGDVSFSHRGERRFQRCGGARWGRRRLVGARSVITGVPTARKKSSRRRSRRPSAAAIGSSSRRPAGAVTATSPAVPPNAPPPISPTERSPCRLRASAVASRTRSA